MTTKKNGTYAPDGAKYATLTDGANALVVTTTTIGSAKQTQGAQAPDNSIYLVLTDGNSNLV